MTRGLDPIIHQTTRLRLMAILVQLAAGDWIDFTSIRDELALTDGNLGAQLQKLEQAGYVKVKKRFVGRKPKTEVQVTRRGRSVFDLHCAALREIMGDA